MKKILTFSFAILFVLNVNSQLTDTTCIKTRWISLKNTSQNNLLFNNLYTDKTIFEELKKLVENGTVSIYNEVEGYQNREKWTSIKTDTSSKHLENSFQYLFKIPSSIPLLDMFGEDSIKIVNGISHYVYPKSEIITFNLSEIKEIRIRENKVPNTKNEFTPVGIGFVSTSIGIQKEIFWVYFNNLSENVKLKENINWCSSIKNKQYSGFQYFQISCSDDKLRY